MKIKLNGENYTLSNNERKLLSKSKFKQKRKGIFSDYQSYFFRLKEEASEFPSYCKTEKDREAYILKYYLENNIILRMDRIANNPSKKPVSKTLLNALFGKLIQVEQTITTVIIHDRKELMFFINSDIHEIIDIYCVNDNYAT